MYNESNQMALEAGARLGPYQIIALIGSGGMGEVYKALDTRLNRVVAVKLLSDALAEAAAHRRFQSEAQLASSLNHPHILTVHDFGEHHGRNYIVTEFVDGGTLKDWAMAEKRSWRHVLDLLAGVADGLATAHEAGITHRDVKSANILVSRNGYAKLADFGLAKLDAHRAEENTATVTGLVVGTVPYMSPEQACGQQATARSDVFSFGAVLYEMLAGKRPFSGKTNFEIIQQVIHARPEPLRAELPAELRRIVEKALEKDPADRYQSMRHMLADLQKLRNDTRSPASAGAGRRRVFAIVAMLLLILAAAAFWAGHGARRSQLAQALAVLPVRNLTNDASQEAMADGITEALISELGKIHSLRVISRTSVMQYKNKEKSLRDIARELDVDAVLESGMQRFGGRFRIDTRLRSASNEAQLWGTQFEREVGDIFRLQAELAQEVAQGIRAEMTSEEARLFTAAKKVNPSAEENYIAGRRALWRGNVKDRLESIKLFDEAVRLQPDYAAAYASRSLAWHLLRAQRAATPQEAYLPALNDAKKALELDPRNAEAYVTLAGVKSFEEWDWAEADRLYKKAQTLNPGSMDLCFCYTFFLYNTGKFKEALVVAERGIRTDPLNATAHTMLGRALYAAREYERALPVLRRAIELNSNNLGARIALARSYLKLGRRDEALAAVDLPSQRPSAVLAYVFAAFPDRREEAVRTLAAVEAQPEPARSSLYDIALAYFALNGVDAGLDRLAKAMERHDSGVAFARYDPALDPVRQNPRFKELVARLKLD